MARVTVEDCLRHVRNRFELVLLASKRARQLLRGGADPVVPWENDKATVVALREIASGDLRSEMITNPHQEKARTEEGDGDIPLTH